MLVSACSMINFTNIVEKFGLTTNFLVKLFVDMGYFRNSFFAKIVVFAWSGVTYVRANVAVLRASREFDTAMLWTIPIVRL